MLLGACHARKLLASGNALPQAWTILGHCCWSLASDLSRGPPSLQGPWDIASELPWAQAAACYRRALELNAGNIAALRSLARLYDIRRLHQARAALAASGKPLDKMILDLEAVGPGVSWTDVEERALALLHLGAPREARNLLERAANPTSAALRQCRIADTHLVAFDLEDAVRVYRQALAEDRSLGSSWFGVCVSLLHQGRPAEALKASRGAWCALTRPQRDMMENVQSMLSRFASN